jgi:hypothetical protein
MLLSVLGMMRLSRAQFLGSNMYTPAIHKLKERTFKQHKYTQNSWDFDLSPQHSVILQLWVHYQNTAWFLFFYPNEMIGVTGLKAL